MSRETKELVTTSGKKVTIKAYLTGRESNEIKKITYKSLSIDSKEVEPGKKIDVGRIPLAVAVEREEKLIELVVVSFEGSVDSAIEHVRDLPSVEYDDLVKKIDAELKVFQKAM